MLLCFFLRAEESKKFLLLLFEKKRNLLLGPGPRGEVREEFEEFFLMRREGFLPEGDLLLDEEEGGAILLQHGEE